MNTLRRALRVSLPRWSAPYSTRTGAFDALKNEARTAGEASRLSAAEIQEIPPGPFSA